MNFADITLSVVLSVIITIVILVIAVYTYMYHLRNPLSSEYFSLFGPPSTSTIAAKFAENQKKRGTYHTFVKLVGIKDFSPLKYAQLTTLYTSGKLTPESTAAVMRE